MTHFSFTSQAGQTDHASDIVIVPVYDKRAPGVATMIAPAQMGAAIQHAMTTDLHFQGKTGQTLTVPAPAGSNFKKMILVGMGATKGMDSLRAETIGGKIYTAVAATGMTSLTILANDFSGANAHMAADLAHGFVLKSYTFDKYKSQAPQAPDYTIRIALPNPTPAREKFAQLAPVAAGAFLARDLANEPPNVLTPKTMAERVRVAMEPLGLNPEIIHEAGLKALGAGAFVAVGQGSSPDKRPMMVVLRYNGTGNDTSRPLALVGKGLTFDTGGLSLKTNMSNMKFDMGGAAAVIGAMAALAGRKAPVDVVAVLGLARNDIGPDANCVDDIVTAMNGKTIDVQNTDAEGRLVLADCLTYVQRRFNPHTVIDLATLTGACKAALGSTMCGVFSNDETLSKRIRASGAKVSERGWPMPLGPEFSAAIRGTYSDLVNIGNGGPGASTAAAFLQEFIEGKTKWAHLDIAGVANGVFGHPTMPDKIGTGFGVRLLNQLIMDHFEKKPKAPKTEAAPAPKA
ncbi:leucyl aminopeptidase [Micavibrio aeruginosavorus]|uniref:leucyl aminopeptidase n=1 Tax=Micavibrio aeruginosavorus TaxID=349221 RepID=UPI003F4AC46D